MLAQSIKEGFVRHRLSVSSTKLEVPFWPRGFDVLIRFSTNCVVRSLVFDHKDLIPNPLHVLQKDLLAAAVIQFRGPAIGVASDSLGRFKGAVIFQEIRNPGRPE
jgi:hypothetical protein